jgi:hypothetical protein
MAAGNYLLGRLQDYKGERVNLLQRFLIQNEFLLGGFYMLTRSVDLSIGLRWDSFIILIFIFF